MPPLHRRGTVAQTEMVGATTIPLLWRGGCVADGVVIYIKLYLINNTEISKIKQNNKMFLQVLKYVKSS
jgi:hypothetical protein